MRCTTGMMRLVASGALAAGVMASGSAGAVSSTTTATSPSQGSVSDDWASVSASGTNQDAGATCGIRLDGTLWCWGPNADGELGLGDTKTRYRPYQVGSATWSQVDAVGLLVCGVQTDETLWCWGAGFGTTPQQVGTATTWTSITIGGEYFCGTQSDTTLWCWGVNYYGQLGLGDYGDHPDPTEVGSDWRSVTASNASTCAVKTDDTLWCWGDDGQGELGDNQAGYPFTDVPQHVAAGTTWNLVTEGFMYACGVQTDQTLWCWGNNDGGQLGLGDSGGGAKRFVPTQVGSDADWTTVTAGVYHTCGAKNAGELWCWGANDDGDLGIGQASGSTLSPVQVGTKAVWGTASSGGEDTCATQLDHTLWCWGNPFDGELGVGDRTKDTTIPVQVGLRNQPDPGTHRLLSVSADSSTDIWAVGSQQRTKAVSTFVLHNDGSTWSQVDALNPSNKDSEFAAVKALTPNDVWAVGSYQVNAKTYPLTEHWNGTSWTRFDAPGGHYESAEFLALDADAPNDIWAVGRTFGRYDYDDSFVDHWDGTAWTAYPINDSWTEQIMTGVVAISPHNAWTVGYGYKQEELARDVPVTYHWNGSNWRQALPKHGRLNTNYYFRGIDATPAKDLWAAGDTGLIYETTETTRIEHHTVGGEWDVVNAPSPGVDSGTYVRAVSAVAANDVWMVGDFDNGTSRRLLTLHWDGSQWTQIAAPSPGGKYDTTGASVTAVASNDVWAVGTWNNNVNDQPYIEHWDGTNWTVVLKGVP